MRVKPWGDMDPMDHWGWLHVAGKTVLDVGADYGSTADFFLEQGALRVVAVEADPKLFRRLAALAAEDARIEAVEMRVSSVHDWERLLQSYKPDVVKSDCEGGEGWLLDLDKRFFHLVSQWAIELHTPEMAARFSNDVSYNSLEALYAGLGDKMVDFGYDLVKDVLHGTGRVVYGVRRNLDVPGKLCDPDEPTRVVILSTQRSGTKFLEECLSSHPDVEIGGEVLRDTPPYPVQVLKDFFAGGTCPVRVCRLMYMQVSEPVILWLQMNEVQVIHLVREDHVRREVSNDLNRRRLELGRTEHHSYGECEPVQIEVDVPWVLRQIQWVKGQIGRFRHLFQGGPYLEVTYQEIVGLEGEEVSKLRDDLACKLYRFLDLDPHPLTSSQRKQNPGDLQSFVTNYAELMRAVWRDYGGEGAFRQRSYASYADYLVHQSSKLELLDLVEYHAKFREVLRERLAKLSFLERDMVVLCLGARSGAEVEAFLDLGHPAIGIDLNPGGDGNLVVEGDFHDLEAESGSIDVVFTNSWDHAYDLRKAISEAWRVLKSPGFLIVEAVPGLEEGAHVDPWDCMIWRTRDDLIRLLESSGFELLERSWFEFPWTGERLCLKKS